MSDFLKKIFEPTARKRTLFFLVFDFLLIELAAYLAFFLRLEGKMVGEQFANLFLLLVLGPIFVIPILWVVRLYWINWTYVGVPDLMRLAAGLTISYLLLLVFVFSGRDIFFGDAFVTYPRSTIIISFVLAMFFLGALRLSKRIHLQLNLGSAKNNNGNGKRAIIVGAGDAGEQILRNMLFQNSNFYTPVGFADDNPFKFRTSIHGYKVLGTIDDIPDLADTHNVKALIIALPSSGSRAIKRAVEAARKAKIKDVKILPSIFELLSEKISLHDLREIQIEDLLGREQVEIDEERLVKFIEGRNVLITGAAGSIGSELSRQVGNFKPSRLVLFDQDETALFYLKQDLRENLSGVPTEFVVGDITNRNKISQVMSIFSPYVVFHSAAYKHVPMVEEQPDEGVRNNILGTLVVAEEAAKNGVEKCIVISTDKAVNPISIMGKTKRIAEFIASYLNAKHQTEFISVRFGNVLGSQGSVIPIFREQIRRGKPVTVTHPDMTRYFMSIREAVLLVIEASAIGDGGKVYILEMGEQVRILDLAREMITLSGLEPDVDIPIVFTEPRSGEKIAEELFSSKNEELKPTSSRKIFEVSSKESHSQEIFWNDLNELFILAEAGKNDEITEKLDSMLD